jgi:hypothetical protein
MRSRLIAVGVASALLAAPAVHAAEIVGRILNVGGEPAANEQVELQDFKSGKIVSELYSDDAGNYRIENVKPGTYIIYVRSQSGVAYLGESGLTVDWGLAPDVPPVAVATRGVTANQPSKSPSAAASPGADSTAAIEP